MKTRIVLLVLILLIIGVWNECSAKGKMDTIPEPIAKKPDGIFYEPFQTEPEFPGGFDALRKFVQSNLKKIKGVAGKRLIASFVVEKDGSLTDIKVTRGINEAADSEAVRVVKLLPKWKPATQNKIVCRVAYSIPITFD